jgi:hypothetical protein
MRKLDDAMLDHIKYIIFNERRPFSYLDFRSFSVQGEKYTMKHGTFRNKISRLVRHGIAELEFKSNITFYTLKGTNFGKKKMMMTRSMTPNHMGVTGVIIPDSVTMANTNLMKSSSPTICDIIMDIPPGKNALHDIHYRFKVPDIWNILYLSKKYQPNIVSKDIIVNTLNINQLRITTTVHKSDTVTVIVACSNTPVAADIYGLMRLSNALTRVEERLSRVVDECGRTIPGGYESLPIPNNESWIITMWHFGYDSPMEYSGPRFCATWKEGRNALARAYSKKMRSSTRLRCELQQHPQIQWKDILLAGREQDNYEYRSKR